MNARTNQLQLTAEYRQIKDAVSVAFHSIMIHRVLGKFKFSSDSDYSLGSLGHEEVPCNHVDLTYIRVNSPEFIDDFNEKVDLFVEAVTKSLKDGYFLSGSGNHLISPSSAREGGRIYGIDCWEDLISTQIKLEFYQRRKRQWPIPEDTAPWEVWELHLNLVRTLNNEDFFRMREYVAEQLSDKVLTICELMNKPQYLPKIPTRLEITSVFDIRFPNCDPYLWRLDSEHGLRSTENISSGTSFVKKLFRDGLAFNIQ
ncbi:unnamed protein product [Meloidogyne enterolobii]|uniref:Uncharacterized protein n=1 Tax=Meloidogyne enterolobii TaxID=390850 RepID=A0ACB0YN73_MELEN